MKYVHSEGKFVVKLTNDVVVSSISCFLLLWFEWGVVCYQWMTEITAKKHIFYVNFTSMAPLELQQTQADKF